MVNESAFGRRVFLAGAAGAAASTLVLPELAHAAVPVGASYFQPMSPQRIADTRPTEGFKAYRRLSDRKIRVKIAGSTVEGLNVPADAVAVVIAVVAINKTPEGNWLKVTPSGADSLVSNLNLDPVDALVANLVTVKLGTSGSAKGHVDLTARLPTEMIVDIAGVYRPTSTKVRAGRFVGLSSAKRLVSDRRTSNNGVVRVPVGAADGIPKSATAVVVNLTAASTLAPGFLSAYPFGESRPTSSNVNFVPGDIRAAGAIVKLGDDRGSRGFNVFVRGQANVFVDISGYYTGEGDEADDEGLFVPVTPVRIMDTRRPEDKAAAGGKSRMWAGWTRGFQLPRNKQGFGDKASGIVMNVTITQSMGAGFVTVLPGQTVRRVVSNVNVSRVNQTAANHVTTAVSTKGVECWNRTGSHLICDVAGWFTGNPKSAVLGAPVDPDPPPAPTPWTLHVPDMGLLNGVFDGAADPIVDRGESWHWSGTGLVGERKAAVVFGHRTSASGPYRRQHLLQANDVLEAFTGDQRKYTYRLVREVLTGSDPREILDASQAWSRQTGNPSFTLVACTGSRTIRDRQPRGGIAFRMVSTFEMVKWEDLA